MLFSSFDIFKSFPSLIFFPSENGHNKAYWDYCENKNERTHVLVSSTRPSVLQKCRKMLAPFPAALCAWGRWFRKNPFGWWEMWTEGFRGLYFTHLCQPVSWCALFHGFHSSLCLMVVPQLQERWPQRSLCYYLLPSLLLQRWKL